MRHGQKQGETLVRDVPLQIQLWAAHIADGVTQVRDIVETSRHFAPYFTRGFYRDLNVTHIAAVKAGSENEPLVWREIVR